MKRGDTWSCVIRGKDSATGISKLKWVGGFSTEQDAKAARDEELIYPDTVTSLMTKSSAPTGSYLTHACTTCGICTPRLCCSPVSLGSCPLRAST